MLKVCTIGIGNAGNQIAQLAFDERQIPGIAMNSSQKDLSNIKTIPSLIVGDEKGAGKNRDEAKRFVKEQVKNLFDVELFSNHITNNDVIFIISSIGGGTGSGMAPMMTDILSRKYSDKLFVLIEVYPPLRESIAAQQNGIDYLKEVQEFMPNAVYMCYDNNRKSDLPTSEMMKSINAEIVEHLAVLKGEYLYPTPYNSIDEKDMLQILKTPGRLAVYTVTNIKEKDIDNKTIEDIICNEIKNVSSNVELDRDRLVKRMGIITCLNEKLNKAFNTDTVKIKELVGEPVEGFEHVSIAADGVANSVSIILSGLSVPDDRLEKIMQRIEEGLDDLKNAKASEILNTASNNDVSALRQGGPKASELDLDDIFSKY